MVGLVGDGSGVGVEVGGMGDGVGDESPSGREVSSGIAIGSVSAHPETKVKIRKLILINLVLNRFFLEIIGIGPL